MKVLGEAPLAAVSGPLLSLRGYDVAYGDRRIIESIDLDVASRGILVIMGPAGTGKSTLLRTLCCDRVPNASAGISGAATFRGAPLGAGNRPMLVAQQLPLFLSNVHDYLAGGLPDRGALSRDEQRQRLVAALKLAGLSHLTDAFGARLADLTPLDRKCLSLIRALTSDPELICIDELSAGLDDDEAARLLSIIKAEGTRRAVIKVTHHQGHAEELADDVVLLAGGRIVEHAPSNIFFHNPRSEATARFLKTGGCHLPSPDARPEHLAPECRPEPGPQISLRTVRPDSQGPAGFRWLVDGQLGGTRQPGVLGDLRQELAALSHVGATVLVTLTEAPLNISIAPFGLDHRWLPIADMGAPDIEAAVRLCALMEQEIERGGAVVYHCLAGHGRTGLMLTAHLIFRGMTAIQALAMARQRKPQWVQSLKQEQFLWDFELHLAMQAHHPGDVAVQASGPASVPAHRAARGRSSMP
jgi:atypical dual specificity phosphatase